MYVQLCAVGVAVGVAVGGATPSVVDDSSLI